MQHEEREKHQQQQTHSHHQTYPFIKLHDHLPHRDKMRFSNFLFFAAAAIAAPTADLEPRNLVARADAKGLEPRQRSNTAVGVIASSLSTLDASVSSNLGSIRK